MPRFVILFAGQRTDLPLEQLTPLAKAMGRDGDARACARPSGRLPIRKLRRQASRQLDRREGHLLLDFILSRSRASTPRKGRILRGTDRQRADTLPRHGKSRGTHSEN
jgi:hypothetical protein